MVAIESHSARTGETRRLAAASEPQRKATDENWHSIFARWCQCRASFRDVRSAISGLFCPITPLSVKKSHRWRAPVRGRDAWFLLASFEPKILSRSAAHRKES